MSEPKKTDSPLMNCPYCGTCIAGIPASTTLRFCPSCGKALSPSASKDTSSAGEAPSDTPWTSTNTKASTVEAEPPSEEETLFVIGPYQVLEAIGKGGMGEVYRAYDRACGRIIALKKVRDDLPSKSQLLTRFLREARITSQLAHPAIIPIYAIHSDADGLYYTMPFVEGKTLREILVDIRRQEKAGNDVERIGGSIPALMTIFLKVCQAIAYSHSRGVLHRDLKPENVMVGEYGEVTILDWGLAKLISTIQETPLERQRAADGDHTHTRLGKAVGTINYMAPERALGACSSISTDIYALGVILYQILTLHLPFLRGAIKEFRKSLGKEEFVEPNTVAPYRDVPPILARIVRTCLERKPSDRYADVDSLIRDINTFIEGRSEWFLMDELDPDTKDDWAFQEPVLIAEHVAITRGTAITDWVHLMVSKESFAENVRVEARLRVGTESQGVGVLVALPEFDDGVNLSDGCCLWLSTQKGNGSKLLRSTVEVMSAPNIILQPNEWITVGIEKVDNAINVSLNGEHQFSYVSYVPLTGTHVGILSRDGSYTVESLRIFSGSHNLTVSCLAVADALLAHRDYSSALSEYRRIGYSFPGRAEGREALFRAGITLLERARHSKNPRKAKHDFNDALDEMSKLHDTPGAPFEYLGKALVYQAQNDSDNELRCYELALRRYQQHPLLYVLHEHILYRMHQASRQERRAAYSLILLAIQHLPESSNNPTTQDLFDKLQLHWEPLPFILFDDSTTTRLDFALQLSFWLAKPWALAEILDTLTRMEQPPLLSCSNALFALLTLGSKTLAKDKLQALKESASDDSQGILANVEVAVSCTKKNVCSRIERILDRPDNALDAVESRTLLYLVDYAIDHEQADLAIATTDRLSQMSLPAKLQTPMRLLFDIRRIWAFLLKKDFDAAGEHLQQYPLEMINQEDSLLHFLYGCWLLATEGPEIAQIHLFGTLEVAYPRTWALAHHHLLGRLDKGQPWHNDHFLWEERQLYRQLSLYYHCIEDKEQASHYQRLEAKQAINAR